MRRIYILEELDIKENLLLEGFSQKFIDKHWLKFHYYLTRVLYKYMRRSKSGNGFVRLHIDSIKKVVKTIKSSTVPQQYRGKSDTIHLYILIRDLLEKWGVIIHFTEQKPDKKNYKCKIKDEWYEQGYSLYKGIIPKKILENIDEVHENQINDFRGVYETLFDSIQKVKVEEGKAIEWLDNAKKRGLRLRDK